MKYFSALLIRAEGLLILSVFFFWFSCAGSSETVLPESVQEAAAREKPENISPEAGFIPFVPAAPSEMTFLQEEFSLAEIAPGVGRITGDRRDKGASLGEREKALLSESYRAAYVDSLLRGVPLAGVLGGDFVHGWPENNPSGWVQNWRGSAPEANSWGIPELVLAIRGIREEMALDRVFVVQGKMLDHYGKSAGTGSANGDMGYGSPRGYEFFHEGKIAQRFDLGLIMLDEEGKGTFLPEAPPSLNADPPPETGVFADGISSAVPPETARAAFVTAWKMALDRGVETMLPDGAGHYISFSEETWDLPGGGTLAGLFVQSFNERSVLLVLPDSSALPPYPRLIASPFLDALLASEDESLPGGKNLEPLDIEFSGGDDFLRAVMRGFALYGIPLSDPMPVKGEDSFWREAQRFSRGWLAGPRMLQEEKAVPEEQAVPGTT